MDLYQVFTGYIKAEFLILIPFTWIVGKALKKAVLSKSDNPIKKVIQTTSSITGALYSIDILIGFLLGLIISTRDGWKLFMESFLLYGIVHGAVCCYAATKLYDKVREE